jgi:hypothetical protein
MRFRVDPRVVRRVIMKDGTSYDVPRSGHVSVRPEHSLEMSRSPVLGDYHDSIGISMPGGPGRICPSDGWVGWEWSVTCGRCGGAL